MNETVEKVKKPIYKRWWFIALAIIIILIGCSKISNSIKNATKGDKIKQSQLELGEYLPKLPNKKGRISTNTSEILDIDLYNVDLKTYNSYLSECKLKFNKDDTSSSNSLDAYNSDNYKISVYYYESMKEMSIDLYAPKKLTEIIWPNNDVANSLPKPKTTMGKIDVDKSGEFSVYIGNVSMEDYNEYVNSCSNAGYNVDYKKTDKEYTAKNASGYKLTVSYSGGNMMYIKVKSEEATPNSETQTNTSTPTSTSTQNSTQSTTSSTSTSKTGISNEFKEAMDSYESYMNEYVEFMKKYNANSSDPSLLSQYYTMLQKYSEHVSAFEKWKSEDMTTEESAYYVDVQARVSKKLLEIN